MKPSELKQFTKIAHDKTPYDVVASINTLHPRHAAWMNGRRFTKSDQKFEIIEGERGMIIFKNLETEKYHEMEEKEFLSKIPPFQLMHTQTNQR